MIEISHLRTCSPDGRTSERKTCPVCKCPGGTEVDSLTDRLMGGSQRYPLYRCPECLLLFLDPGWSSSQIAEFYPEGYWWRQEGRFSQLEKIYRETVIKFDQLRFLVRLFPNPDGLELLDVGCGNGLFVKQAARKGFRAFGLESSPEAVEIARKEGLTSIIQGSVDELGKADQEFDILTLFHCLEHLKNPEDYLLNLKKHLRPPGHLLIQVPNTDSLQAQFFGSSWYGLDCPRHLCNFGERSLNRLLQSSGFSIQKVRYFSLRDNAAALVSSLFPQLDPIAVKISHLRDTGYRNNWSGNLKELIYFKLFILAQPLAFIEAVARRGATMTVYARYTKS